MYYVVSVSKMWSILWFLPISSQRVPTRQSGSREILRPHKNYCFASIPLEDGLVDVVFNEEVGWSKDSGGINEGDGIAMMKVELRVQQPVREGLLSMVNYETTFSQPTQGPISVHSSWPAGPGTESCTQQENRGSNPCSHEEHVGCEQCPQAYQSGCDIPAFSSMQLLSRGKTLGDFDLVRHTLFVGYEPYPVIRKHRGAFVLCCANHLLTVTTLLKVFKKQAGACADLRTIENYKKQIETSIQIEMQPGDASVALHAPCGKSEEWVDEDLRTISLRSQPHAPLQHSPAIVNDQTDSPEEAHQRPSAPRVGREHLRSDYCLHDDGSSVAYDAAK